MKVQLGATGVLAVVGVTVAGYLGWKAYKSGAGIVETVKQAAAQASADVQSGWANNISGPFQRGQNYANGLAEYVGEKAWLYADYAYTGIDPATQQLVTDGEWYGDALARRYDAEQRATGTPPAATSNNGAAFGIYPKAF